ncbi:MAG: hypothetical protein HY914_23380 [Desulfomonile tiedjei]|nr:hypothetical protein [Desulfomonile tiedjei]
MIRMEEGNSLCHALVGMLISSFLVGAFVGATVCDAADKVAPGIPTIGFQPPVLADAPIEMRYLSSGYAVCGPVQVATFAPPDFQIWVPRGALRISVENNDLAVMDVKGRELPRSVVRNGTEVYVCRKGQKLFVIVLGQQEGVE